MILTKRVNYGVKGLLNLARNNNQSFLKKISQEEEIPESYLAKIFQVFVQRGILDSKKGPNGGFYLASELKDISIGKIVECLEGEPNLDRCPLNSVYCENKETCAIFSTWRKHEEAKNNMLKTITIADIMSTCTEI
ncbi:MAG: Rrf2 family transcriptional regulator [Candidatus Latescibacteria bacterium]|nr:Rrf2 family transcriptional regulator [Candidatus Latescibacterota bacterium]NIM66368.1 Rrf2 family transcriptional regulator [Candidatus Latescibacterota bacterium]NIO02847.1 Rrf2 family transcriptional regulator [Candidatus Latescibacterota bacterium]NIO29982.1 Rrf2 family transcriptional regulator [Candidatus Latescibacterota bacterium]NIO57597.1 Rrf2 family transcriptional regulator [Candidatus Latescibacterota bacterium]